MSTILVWVFVGLFTTHNEPASVVIPNLATQEDCDRLRANLRGGQCIQVRVVVPERK